MSNKTRSYKLKFWLPLSSLFIFICLMSSIILFNYRYEVNSLHKQTKQKIQMQMDRLRLRLEVLILKGDADNIERELSIIGSMPQAEAIALIDTKGKILIAGNRLWKGKYAKDLLIEFDLNRFNRAQEQFHTNSYYSHESNRYFVYTPISLRVKAQQELPHQGGVLYFVYDNSLAHQTIWQNTFNQSLIGCVSAFLLMLLVLFIHYVTIGKPLKQLIRFAEKIGEGDFSAVNPLDGKGELMMFGQTLERTSQQLEQREQNLAITLNSIADAVITTDVEGRVSHMNPVAERLTGWSLTEAKSLALKTILPIIDASTREPIENSADKVIATGETVFLSNHATLVAKDGTEHQIADSAAPILDAHNNILGMVLVFNDVTENYRIREKLKHSQQRLMLHWQDTPLGIVEWNTDFEFLDLNPAAEKIFGFSKAEVQGRPFTEHILPESSRAAVEKIGIDLMASTGGTHSINENITKDGRTITCEWYNTPLINEEGKVIGISSLVIDITEKQKAEEMLRLSSRFFTETNEGILITDAKVAIIDVNPAFCDITGYSREEVIGKKPRFLDSGKQSPKFFRDLWKILKEQGHWKGELWNCKKDGSLFAELLSISSIVDKNDNILNYVGLFADITHSKQQQEKLVQMAHYDVLTQLPNRTLLADRYIQATAHCKRNKTLLAFCFLDLDNFKPVNDRYGHDAGDQLLIEVAKRFLTAIREEDTVSRQGGDEFALLLGDIKSAAHCEQLLERILHSIAEPYIIDQQSVSISASIGVSLYPQDGTDLDTLMRHADQAMYLAKLNGRNQYSFFNAEQNQLTIQKNIKLQEIQATLSNNDFCLHYQPKVNMSTGAVFGAEALIRWLHPKKGLILPLDFLPIIEGTELEILVGNWVINEALKQLGAWKEQGIELEISINISSYHLQSPLFVAKLEEALARFPNVDPGNFQLEILESSALSDIDAVNNIIKTCMHTLGVNVALDDFGTGHSSLTHLRNIVAKTIKIDKSFVIDMLGDPNDHAIIDGVIGLAHSFNRDVIAEGVETTKHGSTLLLMRCNKAQGYGIAKPMPASEFPDWLASYIPNEEWLVFGKKAVEQKKTRDSYSSLV
jgi:diguanylate cyclase (GGDEF)-like protein/PAS domain S-box-containing protein